MKEDAVHRGSDHFRRSYWAYSAEASEGILLTFSRVLKWMLDNHHDMTMASLVGLMAGSLRKLWPFVEPNAEGEMGPALPAEIGGDQAITIALLVAGMIAVILLERAGRDKIKNAG